MKAEGLQSNGALGSTLQVRLGSGKFIVPEDDNFPLPTLGVPLPCDVFIGV